MSETAGRTVGELRTALQGGDLSVTDLLQATRAAIAAADADEPSLGAFLWVAGDELDARAAELDRALAAGEKLGPLAGVPVAVKDNICTLDGPTTCGSRILEDYRSPYEATAVQRLRQAGALIVAKTNLDEFGMGSSNENSAFGPARNPVDLTRVPGGSSGGSAAAVAAGLVPLALGSDTGGSVRQPASFCGVVGLKPTYGRVSRHGLVAFASSLEGIGPIAGRVEDAATALNVMAGFDENDSTSARALVPDFCAELDAGVDGLTVGVPREYFPDDLDPGIEARSRTALEWLEGAGAKLREISLPHTEYAIATYYLVANAEASSNLARYDGVRYGWRAPGAESTSAVYRESRGGGFGGEVKRRIALGTYGLSAGYHEEYYGRGQRVRRLIAADFERAFDDGIDVIFTPTSPTVAFELGERLDDPVQMYLADVFTATANLAGLPAISVPIGALDRLPVGGQLIGQRFDEATVLRAAYVLEHQMNAR
ncbi:MAG: Asp-tRNA(Asn)/Glu-tRNA(Gln) amidotransferase subunit GatA [Gemmatimonadetes bacterium]|uniref:Glutamyl-tRNA(Gln) amidotransferase subunit A n=1 Tax=Candidatus Kutchimonas denitrificans TaxID=3056748 RepID=A0AAE4ZBM1_9BACT|nr:Asp-tRNA(Asn)/Glu-tRNA(Gln) amidotransferase subunit GatA [Gemmatimonadota bacterium]NIR76227.1 Asp-tRNA(Asn)/Glu-tRNA(Gln) amidotransferase subunit GatA [Candidatus Kutchimonas denitrificans]NIS00667.1 Asp-tRNA(Asn)/Glu-tRNA(Gln) amidotransferase subunit GatA [Gemmatimonadota bacterium]NIT66812.1 Asp-tRNA(Asn)/Glu-tRNA(Gln) amidotransferase subunit GatA [Gemmatimonadota bacterium]NIV23411.1 Asp-tRNA(Asn)/Glu-tRNA(Gln) amidotransferase subunit GatA [Gemmatimonadota bacterium]